MSTPAVIEFLAQFSSFGLFVYKWIVIIAILLTWVGPDPRNPVVYWINRITRPLWGWCYQWLPVSLKFYSAYVSLLVVIFAQVVVPATLRSLNLALHDRIPEGSSLITQLSGHLLQGTGIVVSHILWFFILILAIWFILTLVSPSTHNPIVQVAYTLADPLITPIQKYLPRTKVDLSPVVGIAIFFLISTYVISPVISYGALLSSPISVYVY